jgi:hypothetical protein
VSDPASNGVGVRAIAAAVFSFGFGFAVGTELTYRRWREHYDRLLRRYREHLERSAELERWRTGGD